MLAVAGSIGTAFGAADGGPAASVAAPADRVDNAVSLPVERHVPPRRAIMISDSVLAGVDVYGQTDRLTGADWFTDHGVCRRLVGTSCKATGSPRPPTLVQELNYLPFVPDRFDLFVVATGYNDSSGVLAANYDLIVDSIRARGFVQIAWLNYRTAMGGTVGRNSANLNAILHDRAAADPHVHVWDFDGFTFGRPWFVADRTHLSPTGAGIIADWLSQHVVTIDVD